MTIPITITVHDRTVDAELADNAAGRALAQALPLHVETQNLYRRELVHRFTNPLPADELRRSGYDVGEIAYWAPRHSLVIFYAQNGEVIDQLQHVGRITGPLTDIVADEPGTMTIEARIAA